MSTPGSTHATRARGIDLEHAVHPRGDDDHRVVERRRAAGEAGAAPPRDERPAVAAGDAHRGGDLVGRRGQHTATARASVDPGVAPVERELERLGTRTGRTERGAEIGEQRVVSDVANITDGARVRSPNAHGVAR